MSLIRWWHGLAGSRLVVSTYDPASFGTGNHQGAGEPSQCITNQLQ